MCLLHEQECSARRQEKKVEFLAFLFVFSRKRVSRDATMHAAVGWALMEPRISKYFGVFLAKPKKLL